VDGLYDLQGGYTQVGQYLYIVGGLLFTHIFQGEFNSSLCKRLDMASNTWSVGPAWTFRRRDFALAPIGNKLLAIGGDLDEGTDSDATAEVDELDTSTWPNGTWVRTPYDLPSPRFGNRAGFASTNRAGGEVWSTGGTRYTGIAYVLTADHLFLPTHITSGGSSISAAGPNGVLDPGETVTVSLGIRNIGEAGFCTTDALIGTLQTSGGVMSPSGPQNYGALCSGGLAFRNFTFTIDPTLPCSSDVTVSLVITDGATNYGTINYVFPTGNLATIFAENFDEVVPPALPKGWEASTIGNLNPSVWVTSSTDSDSLPNDAFISSVFNLHNSSDARLDSPAIFIPSAYTRVTFRHSYSLSGGGYIFYDGGMLEISSPNINGGAFTDVIDPAVGGSFVTGGYNGPLQNSNVLGGRLVWGTDSGGYITTVANLGPNVEGQMIKLRFRMSTTGNGGGIGWRIDSLSIGTPACGGSAPAVISAVSRKTHGAAGAFHIDLPLVPLDGNIGIENRSGSVAGEHQIVVTFAGPVTAGRASITTGTGNVVSSVVNGAVVTINLTGVTDAQRFGVTIPNVSDGSNLGSIMIPMGVLAGDTNANGTVNSSDLAQIKSESGQPVTASNFREDVDGDGIINAKDVSTVKMKSGAALP
jgi:dockerin type I repeat protein